MCFCINIVIFLLLFIGNETWQKEQKDLTFVRACARANAATKELRYLGLVYNFIHKENVFIARKITTE